MQNFLGHHRSEAERTGLIHLDGGDGRALPLLVMAQIGQQRLTRRLYLRRQAALAENANQPRTQRGCAHGEHPQRDALTVQQAAAGAALDGVADGVAEVQHAAQPVLVRILLDDVFLDRERAGNDLRGGRR